MAPEQIIRDVKQPQGYVKQLANNSRIEESEGFASDLWSIGCVFAEMFVSLTPVFQAVDTFERTIRFFEVIGLNYLSKVTLFLIGVRDTKERRCVLYE